MRDRTSSVFGSKQPNTILTNTHYRIKPISFFKSKEKAQTNVVITSYNVTLSRWSPVKGHLLYNWPWSHMSRWNLNQVSAESQSQLKTTPYQRDKVPRNLYTPAFNSTGIKVSLHSKKARFWPFTYTPVGHKTELKMTTTAGTVLISFCHQAHE